MVTFVKLGGSLITDKTQESTFLAGRTARLAAALTAAWRAGAAPLLIGHGSGSFGHFAAQKYGTIAGVRSAEEWRGFAEVARTAAQLNELVTQSLAEAGLPVWAFQPSASARAEDGLLAAMAVEPLRGALDAGLVPLVHGDVALDSVRGGTIISTEAVFFYLAPWLRPQHIYLLGEVPGVLDSTGQVVPRITPDNFESVRAALGGSHGVDVTGGMATKVADMLRLVTLLPDLRIHILSGLDPETVEAALRAPESSPGTVICAV